ncbi:hypothetical protein C2G38_2187976 [Gigaspora rosea]|uniref:Uncharacterized protein n=1 Tax=Gigaspora rosea TaxID=44941 RepID=A0A397V8H2_9GLOM|nr:hypothetical protein C2G38_2187976 [Gigaspora rosea]
MCPPDPTTSFIVYLYVATKITRDGTSPNSDRSNLEEVNTADLLEEATLQQKTSCFSSIGALAAYLYKKAKNANLVQTPAYTTYIKYNISLQHKLYQAIINSGASISMIAHKTVKKLGLTIEKASNSLIVPVVGTSI